MHTHKRSGKTGVLLIKLAQGAAIVMATSDQQQEAGAGTSQLAVLCIWTCRSSEYNVRKCCS